MDMSALILPMRLLTEGHMRAGERKHPLSMPGISVSFCITPCIVPCINSRCCLPEQIKAQKVSLKDLAALKVSKMFNH